LLSGSIAPADIPRICAAAHRLMAATEDGTVVCDVEALVSPDAAAVDALARLQLAARRLHREIRLERASEELAALIELSGLSDVIPNGAGSGLEPRSQAE
jgi:ABC-type transporter Mla MlaB component